MKPRLTLRDKVLLLALLNAVLLAAALTWFTRTQLTQDPGALLLSESRGRITEVAMQLGREMPLTAHADRDSLLARYSTTHGVTFRLFHNNGTQLGGPPVTPPAAVIDHMRIMRLKSPLAERPEIMENFMKERMKQEGMKQGELKREMKGDFPLKPPQMDLLLQVVTDPPFFARGDNGDYWVVFRMPVRSKDQPGFQPGLLVLSSESFFGTPFLFNLRPWLALMAVFLAIILICWLPLVRGVNRAIAALAVATSSIAKGNFNAKVDIRRADELGQLGDSLNRMSDQLEGYVQGQKRFLRDAAHELRSPLARMQAALGNILESPVSPEVEPLLEDLREEIELMSSLTSELIAFAREEASAARLSIAPVDLASIARRAVETENADGVRDVRVHVEEGVKVLAHSESLFRGLSNAVRNAIRYAGDTGPITLTAEQSGNNTIITVSDHGPGLPEEALEMVFTPFYRLDVSRARSTGGNGLGMSITRTCAENCGGTVHCRNANPGLEVIFTLQSA
jgi:two-component system sensor histidine kinase CpxA